MDKPHLGAIVRNAREERGLSRERLAFRSDVSSAMIVRLETMDKEPNPTALARIAAQLGLSVEQLLDASSVHWYGKTATTVRKYHKRGAPGKGQTTIPLDAADSDKLTA